MALPIRHGSPGGLLNNNVPHVGSYFLRGMKLKDHVIFSFKYHWVDKAMGHVGFPGLLPACLDSTHTGNRVLSFTPCG